MEKLFWFNPDCELAIANGSPYYMPPANIVRMEQDLAFLPAYLGEQGDYVRVEQPLPRLFQQERLDLGIAVCPIAETELGRVPVREAEPWGWSPKLCHTLHAYGLAEEWNPERTAAYSRKLAKKALGILLAEGWGTPELMPRICETIQEVAEAIKGQECVAKAPWSSSGKGLLFLRQEVSLKEKEWLSGILRRQGYVMLEKRLNKLSDFAMEFRKGKEGVEFIGWSVFRTGNTGEYLGNRVGAQEQIGQQLTDYLGNSCLDRLRERMPKLLEEILPKEYTGYLGVDMMVFRDEQGEVCLQPCVEINLRCNMGIIALALSQRYIAPGSEGEFTIRYFSGAEGAWKEHLRLQKEQPVRYENNRIYSGYFPLTPVLQTSRFMAALQIRSSFPSK